MTNVFGSHAQACRRWRADNSIPSSANKKLQLELEKNILRIERDKQRSSMLHSTKIQNVYDELILNEVKENNVLSGESVALKIKQRQLGMVEQRGPNFETNVENPPLHMCDGLEDKKVVKVVSNDVEQKPKVRLVRPGTTASANVNSSGHVRGRINNLQRPKTAIGVLKNSETRQSVGFEEKPEISDDSIRIKLPTKLKRSGLSLAQRNDLFKQRSEQLHRQQIELNRRISLFYKRLDDLVMETRRAASQWNVNSNSQNKRNSITDTNIYPIVRLNSEL